MVNHPSQPREVEPLQRQGLIVAFVACSNLVWFAVFGFSAMFMATVVLLGVATELVCGSDPP